MKLVFTDRVRKRAWKYGPEIPRCIKSSFTCRLTLSLKWNLCLPPSCETCCHPVSWKPLLRVRCGCKDGSSLVGCLGVNRLPLNTRERCVFSIFSTDNQRHCNTRCPLLHWASLSRLCSPEIHFFSAGNMPQAFKDLLLWILSPDLGFLTFLSGNPERLCKGTHFLILSQTPNIFPLISLLLFA